MRDNRLVNLAIVERQNRDKYYAKLKQMGIVLAFSGGLDSATVLHWAIKLFGQVHCLCFDYGQRHKIEIRAAEKYLMSLFDVNVTYQIVDMSPINKLGSSSLTRDDVSVPRNTPIEDMGKELPNTFVPGRNVYFITALAQAAFIRGWRHIAMGVNVLDYSGYPDCRPEFMAAMRKALSIGIFNGHDIGVHAPLMYLNKAQIIRLGLEMGVDYSLTHSCYNGVKGGCGECDSCQLRRKAFSDLGMTDPSIIEN
jgi:7-cyano-7-deazaguanine synthase